LILILGILGFCCCFFSIAAIIMGFMDLSKMNSGEMDSSGKGLTIAGIVIAFLMLVLNLGLGIANDGGGGP